MQNSKCKVQNERMKFFLHFALCILNFALINVSINAQDDDGVIRVDSSIVVVNAMITDAKGRPAEGLKQNQFKLFVDGTQQEIVSFTTESTPFAAIILLDTSGSMEQRVSLARSA